MQFHMINAMVIRKRPLEFKIKKKRKRRRKRKDKFPGINLGSGCFILFTFIESSLCLCEAVIVKSSDIFWGNFVRSMS